MEYYKLARRWLWLLLLAGFVGGGVGYVMNAQQPSTYQARLTLSVGNFIESANPDSDAIWTGMQLVPTYAYLVTSQDILEATASELGDVVNASQLSGMVSVKTLPDTSLLQIFVTGLDPVLVADVANEIGRQLILNGPTNLTSEQRDQMQFADSQIERLNNQLETLYTQLDLIDRNIAATAASDTDRLEQLNYERLELVDRINYSTSIIASFSVSITDLQQRTNSIEIMEQAYPPEFANTPNGASQLILSALVAVSLAFGAVLVFEYVNNKIRSPQDITRTLSTPVLVAITRQKTDKRQSSYPLVRDQNFDLPFVESYHAAHTNLMALHDENQDMAFVITSAFPREGKSLTCANLAITIAQSKRRVLLIDADLRMPSQHAIFEFENNTGLSDLLHHEPSEADIADYVQSTHISGLSLMSSGSQLSASPSVLLGSSRMKDYLDMFKTEYDIILIDTPPVLSVPDSISLVYNTPTQPLLVIEAGRTDVNAAANVAAQFDHIGSPIKGVILNKVKAEEVTYYGYYGY